MALLDPTGDTPEPYRFIAVMWLSFLLAGAIGMVLFVFFDPSIIYPCTDLSGIPALGLYTIAFLILWLITAVAGIGTLYFLYPRKLNAAEPPRPDIQ